MVDVGGRNGLAGGRPGFEANPESSGERELLLEILDLYRRGLRDAPLLRKWNGGTAGNLGTVGEGMTGMTGVAGATEGLGLSRGDGVGGAEGPGSASGGYLPRAGAEAPMPFVVSSQDVDRHGDVVLAGGWRLAAYRQNPVFLWAHDYTRPVIGRAVSVWPEGERLLALLEFAPTDFAREVAALYRSGYQQGVSVGFKPLRYEERRQEGTGAFLGIRFLEQELLEISAVPVPSNRQALRREAASSPFYPPSRRAEGVADVKSPPDPGDPPSPGLPQVLAALRDLAREKPG